MTRYAPMLALFGVVAVLLLLAGCRATKPETSAPAQATAPSTTTQTTAPPATQATTPPATAQATTPRTATPPAKADTATPSTVATRPAKPAVTTPPATKPATAQTAAPATPAASATTTHAIALAADEAACPVMGEVMKKADMTPITYKGTTYYMCCKSCIGQFNADPEKFIANPAPIKRNGDHH